MRLVKTIIISDNRLEATSETMKIKQAINLHKGATAPLVLGLMFAYDNFTIAPWIYLSLHVTYGMMWLIKDA